MPDDETATPLVPAPGQSAAASEGNNSQTDRNGNKPVAVVGLGASAGGIQVLQRFFQNMPAESGLAFVVVMHLSPDHESNLAEILQARTNMPVIQVNDAIKVEKDHVYVIPPNKHLSISDSTLVLNAPQQEIGRRVTIDLFFRTLAEHYGQRALCIIFSGADSDGVIGLKHIKAQGGVTIAQEPAEAEYDSMPRHAIETGMVDWILPVSAMAARLLDYVENEKAITLPPEHNGEMPTLPDLADATEKGGPLTAKQTTHPDDENALAQVLVFLRANTGHDFSHYKRATVLRRIARRLQVNSLETLPSYLEFLQTHSGEARALMSDLLINVTHFFRDPKVFAALETRLPQLLAGKGSNDQLRIWVPGCATGEEAYSLAILMSEATARAKKPLAIQIFATDIDEDAIRKAREGIYPATIEADVSQERLRRYFLENQGHYRIKKEVRELLLFAQHDLLRDSPFSRLDLISCRNLLIYLNPEAQHRAIDIFHFALHPGGALILGSAESVGGDHALFAALDKPNRVYVRRNTVRPPSVHLLVKPQLDKPSKETVLPQLVTAPEGWASPKSGRPISAAQQRLQSLGEMHVRIIEEHGPASLIVDENYDIIHMSARAGAYLRFTAGEPSANLLRLVDNSLRLELRTALFRVGQSKKPVVVSGVRAERDGQVRLVDFRIWPSGENDPAPVFLVMLDERLATDEERAESSGPQPYEPVTHLEAELGQMRDRLNSTVEHYETSNEELKAANEELQAMNEEMRSATEELETSKEELQSVNEELTTLNQELKNNIEEVNRSNSDLQNLIASTDIATVFLDSDLRIKRYTPRAQDLFSLIPSDLGRQLSDIRSKLEYQTLIEDAAQVLRTLEKIEREVRAADNCYFLACLSPYRTVDDRINGVVIAFIDITESKRIKEALAKSEEQFRRAIDKAPIPVIMHAEDGSVLQVSQTWTELTGYNVHDVPTFDAWLTRAYGEGADEVRSHMKKLFEGAERSIGVEFPIKTRAGATRYWSFSASSPGTLRDGRRFIIGMAVDITERKRTEDALRSSELRLQKAISIETVGVVSFNRDGAFTGSNNAFLELTGFTRKEIESGRLHWDDLTPEEWHARSREAFAELHTHGRTTPYQKQYFRKDGSRFWGLFAATKINDNESVKFLIDISDQKRVEEALRESEERFRVLVEGAKDYAMFVMDLDNVITYWSTGAERIFGWSANEAEGQSGNLIFTPEDKAKGEVQKEIATAMQDGRAPDRRWHLRKDGSRLWVDGVMTRLDDVQGEPRGLAKIARDATEQAEAEQALRHARDQLEQRVLERTADLMATNNQLERAMVQRDQLERELLDISERERRRIGQDLHDIVCQELTATALFLKSAGNKAEDSETAKTLNEAAQVVNRNVAIARDLARGFQPTVLTAGGLPAALRTLCKDANERRGIHCTLKLPRTVRIRDETIALNLFRIAQEAMRNAITHSGGDEIVICIEREKSLIRLVVEDNGRGFRPRKQGKGLGLHIMKYRANALGGELRIEGRKPAGTKVVCEVPVKK